MYRLVTVLVWDSKLRTPERAHVRETFPSPVNSSQRSKFTKQVVNNRMGKDLSFGIVLRFSNQTSIIAADMSYVLLLDRLVQTQIQAETTFQYVVRQKVNDIFQQPHFRRSK